MNLKRISVLLLASIFILTIVILIFFSTNTNASNQTFRSLFISIHLISFAGTIVVFVYFLYKSARTMFGYASNINREKWKKLNFFIRLNRFNVIFYKDCLTEEGKKYRVEHIKSHKYLAFAIALFILCKLTESSLTLAI